MRLELVDAGHGYDEAGHLYVRLATGEWRLAHGEQARSDSLFQRYVAEMGREPPALSPDDSLAWQWDTDMLVRERRERLRGDGHQEP